MFNDEVKSYADVQRVINAGKPDAVIEKFAAMYLKSLDPRRPIVAKWQAEQDQIERFERIITPIVDEYTDEDGNVQEVVRYEGRELDEYEQGRYDFALAQRAKLEDGYATPAVLDDEGNEVEPEFFTEGNAWLKSLRGVEGADPIPEWEPMDTAAFLGSSFPERRKAKRDKAVSEITVTISTSKTFDGDERSQDRMARAVAIGEAGMTTQWKLADNSVVEVTWEELKEALFMAGQKQTLLWVS